MTVDFAPLFYWVRERERIRIAKEEDGAPAPWTEDSILATYRFCNVRREDDLVTLWISENIRQSYAGHPLLWLMLCIARQINWPDTLDDLIGSSAWPSNCAFHPREITKALNYRKARGEKIYTGAYMISAPSQKGADKQAYIARNRDRCAVGPARCLPAGTLPACRRCSELMIMTHYAVKRMGRDSGPRSKCSSTRRR
jgi:hypothetical protein